MSMIPDLLEEIEQLRCEVEELEDDSHDEALFNSLVHEILCDVEELEDDLLDEAKP